MIGTYVLSAGYYDAYYLRAQKVRTLIKRDFEDCFAHGVDAMLTPATPSAAFGVGEKGGADPVEMYLNDVFTVTVNMAGLPGISVPAGLDAQGLPLGLQLIGRPFDEETLFSLGEVIEQAAGRLRAGAVVVTHERASHPKLIKGATGDWEVVIGMEVHAQVTSQVEAVLRRLDRIRRRAQPPCLAGRRRDARHAAGDQRGMRARRRSAPGSGSRPRSI